MDQNRKTAFDIIMAVEKDGAFLNLASKKIIGENKPSDPGLVRNIAHGTVTWKIYLDHILDQLIKTGIDRVKIREKIILRMGLYQIAKMPDIPDYAAVSQSTELAKKVCRGREGFINGVLRGYLKQRDTLIFPKKDENPREYLNIMYSAPLWLTDMWTDQFGAERCEEMLSASLTRPPLTIRVNILRTDRESLSTELRKSGFAVNEGTLSSRALTVSGGNSIIDRDGYRKGLYSVQDESAIYIADSAGVFSGCSCLDMCAAPGGKSLAMAELMKNKGVLTACDIYEHKLELISRQAKRLGVDIIRTLNMDGTAADPSMAEKFDTVLADVPCSGLGVIRRKPEIKYKDPAQITELIKIQRAILKTAASYVRKGGTLIYSTCTVNKDENTARAEEFLEEHDEFELISERQIFPAKGHDGAYICRMKKRGD